LKFIPKIHHKIKNKWASKW